MSHISHSITHTESDVALRLVEVWYDSTWAYFMSSHSSQISKRVDRRRNTYSSSATVASSIAEGSVFGKGVNEKLDTLEQNLKDVRKRIDYSEFKELCACCLKSSDQLYPGFKDIPLIVHFLLKGNEAYNGLIDPKDVERITLPMIYQCIYYQFCDFILQTAKGAEAMKLIITPGKITQAAYDICRRKFCSLLVDEVEIIQFGLFRLIHKIKKHKSKHASTDTTHESPKATIVPVETEDIKIIHPVNTLVQEPEAIAKPTEIIPEVVEVVEEEIAEVPVVPVPVPELPTEVENDVVVEAESVEVTEEKDIEEGDKEEEEEETDDNMDMERIATASTASSLYSSGPFFSPYSIPRATYQALPRVSIPPVVFDDEDSVSSLEEDE